MGVCVCNFLKNVGAGIWIKLDFNFQWEDHVQRLIGEGLVERRHSELQEILRNSWR